MTFPCTEAILYQIDASGPQEAPALRSWCNQQASDYTPEVFTAALQGLVANGSLEIDNDTPGCISYDHPASYYTS